MSVTQSRGTNASTQHSNPMPQEMGSGKKVDTAGVNLRQQVLNRRRKPRNRMLWVFSRSSYTDNPASARETSHKSRFSTFLNSRFSSVRSSRDWGAAHPMNSVFLNDVNEKDMATIINNSGNTRGFSAQVYAPDDRPEALNPDGEQELWWAMKENEQLRVKRVNELEEIEKKRKRKMQVCPVLYLFMSPELPEEDQRELEVLRKAGEPEETEIEETVLL